MSELEGNVRSSHEPFAIRARPAASPLKTSASPGLGLALSECCQNVWKLRRCASQFHSADVAKWTTDLHPAGRVPTVLE